jgi:hypothetical protein
MIRSLLRRNIGAPSIRAALPLLALISGGCHRYLHDDRPAARIVRFSGANTACFESVLPALQAFVKGAATAEQVESAGNCASGAIDDYLARVRGDSPDGYEAVEIRFFLQRNLLGSLQVSDALLGQAMKLKRALLGGSIDRVTAAEMRQAQAAIAIFKKEALKILPYVKILVPEGAGNGGAGGSDGEMEEKKAALAVDPGVVAGASRQIAASAVAIAKMFGHGEGVYSLGDAQVLLNEIDALYSQTSKWGGPQWLRAHIAPITALKAVFVRLPGDSVEPSEWPQLIESLGRLYSAYIQFRYVVSSREGAGTQSAASGSESKDSSAALSGESLAGLTESIDGLLRALAAGVASKPDGVVHWELINTLIDEFYAAHLLGSVLQKDTVKKLAQTLVERVFNWSESVDSGTRGLPRCAADNPDGGASPCEPLRGLTAEAVRQMRRDFVGWAEMQRVWDRIEARVASRQDSQKSASKRLRLPEIEAALKQVLQEYKAVPPEYKDAFDEMASQLRLSRNRRDSAGHPVQERSRPLAYSPEGTLLFDHYADALSVDRSSFTALNWRRLVIRAAIRGFAADPEAARWRGLDKNEFHAFFMALRPTAIDLHLVAKSDDTSWDSTFDEADTFLFSSNGDGILSFDEGVDLISFALSGSKMSRVAYSELNKHCSVAGDLDDFALDKLGRNCYRVDLKAFFPSFFAPVPGWADYVLGFGESQWDGVRDDFLKATMRVAPDLTPFQGKASAGEGTPLERFLRTSPQAVDSTDIDRMSMIVQYIESMFVRFDEDNNGTLSEAEAKNAFPVFKRLLRLQAQEKLGNDSGGPIAALVLTDSGLEALFQYLLRYGKNPEWYEFAASALPFGGSAIDADRGKLLSILASLKFESLQRKAESIRAVEEKPPARHPSNRSWRRAKP